MSLILRRTFGRDNSDEVKRSVEVKNNEVKSNDKKKTFSYLRLRDTLISISLILLAIFIFKTYKPPINSHDEYIYTTTCNFVDEMPDLEQVLDYRVSYRRAANLVEKSLIFESYSTQISGGLRNLCDRLLIASLNLNKLYRGGIHLFKYFDEEINLIMNRFSSDSSYKRGDMKYIFETIKKIIIELSNFKQLIEQTNALIDTLEHDRHVTEAHIINGLRDAQKFSKKNDLEIQEIKIFGNISNNLDNTAIYLDKVKKILMEYESNLLNVLFRFNSIIKDKDGIFEISKKDVKHLEHSVGYLKSIHYKFIQK